MMISQTSLVMGKVNLVRADARFRAGSIQLESGPQMSASISKSPGLSGFDRDKNSWNSFFFATGGGVLKELRPIYRRRQRFPIRRRKKKDGGEVEKLGLRAPYM